MVDFILDRHQNHYLPENYNINFVLGQEMNLGVIFKHQKFDHTVTWGKCA